MDQRKIGYSEFNALDEFVILFDLELKGHRRHPFAMLSVVWSAPELPQKDDIVHIGGGKNDFVLKVIGRDRGPLSWSGGHAVTMDAELLHIKSWKEFMSRFRNLLDESRNARLCYSASLHILTGVELRSAS